EATATLKQMSNVTAAQARATERARAARAQVASAVAARDIAKIQLSHTRIFAPCDGVLSKKSVAPGESMKIGQNIAYLVTPDVWVEANFKETQISHMRPGQPVDVRVDAYPRVTLKGQVENFSGATGSRFSLLPPDNASGNFTKVVQRVPLRI